MPLIDFISRSRTIAAAAFAYFRSRQMEISLDIIFDYFAIFAAIIF